MKAMITIQRIIVLSVVTVLACCSHLRAQATFFGDSLSLGNGIVRPWVEIGTEKQTLAYRNLAHRGSAIRFTYHRNASLSGLAGRGF